MLLLREAGAPACSGQRRPVVMGPGSRFRLPGTTSGFLDTAFVGWAKRQRPPEAQGGKAKRAHQMAHDQPEGGHGANAPLPTLRNPILHADQIRQLLPWLYRPVARCGAGGRGQHEDNGEIIQRLLPPSATALVGLP